MISTHYISKPQAFVHGNYGAVTTGVFFIRRNAAGRSIMMDWLAAALSGRIQCHGMHTYTNIGLYIAYIYVHCIVINTKARS
jgi:hypothetical protein